LIGLPTGIYCATTTYQKLTDHGRPWRSRLIAPLWAGMYGTALWPLLAPDELKASSPPKDDSAPSLGSKDDNALSLPKAENPQFEPKP